MVWREKRSKPAIILGILLLLGGIVLGGGCGPGPSPVEKVRGSVVVVDIDGNEAALSADDKLAPGSTVRAGSDGYALLKLSGGVTVRITPGTEITIPEEPGGGQADLSRMVINMARGLILCIVPPEKQQGTFGVETERVSLSVRGTEFLVEVLEGEMRVAVREGTVRLVDNQSGKTVDLGKDQHLVITGETTDLNPEFFTWMAEKENWDPTIPLDQR